MNDELERVLAENRVAAGFAPSANGETVLHGKVAGAKAMPMWTALREAFPRTGYWPVIRGEAGGWWMDQPGGDPRQILPRVPQGTAREILADQFQARREWLHQLLERLVDPRPSSPGQFSFVRATRPRDDLRDIAARFGNTELGFDDAAALVDQSAINSFGGRAEAQELWPTTPPPTEWLPQSVSDIVKQTIFPEVGISLVQVQQPCDVAAYVGLVEAEDNPSRELQVAALREWNKAYGAVPVAITGDVIECAVDRPPQREADAMSLAVEQWIFCDDIVGQGTQSVRKLAMEIWRSPRWFFWWD